MVFLETMLGSKLNPLVSLGKSGSLGLKGFVNKFNADAELLDDLVRLDISISPSLYPFSHVQTQSSARMIIGRPDTTR